MSTSGRRHGDRRFGSRLLGIIALASGASCVPILFVPGMLVPGRGHAITIGIAAFMIVAGVVLLSLRRAVPHLDAIMIISGDVIWAAFRLVFEHADLTDTPVYLCILAATAGAVLSRREIIVKTVLLVPLIVVGMWMGSSGPLIPAVVINAIMVMVLLTWLSYRMRRQSEALIDRLDELSGRDALTGLDNRRRFEEQGELLIEQIGAEGLLASVIMVDLDHFKQINDTRGHAVGDQVIVQTADCLEQLAHSDPAVRMAVRLGGEEFLLLCAVTDPQQAQELGEQVHRAVGAFPDPATVTCSVGVACAPVPTGTAPALGPWLLGQADVAMYRAKQAGRNQVVLDDAAPPTLQALRSRTAQRAAAERRGAGSRTGTDVVDSLRRGVAGLSTGQLSRVGQLGEADRATRAAGSAQCPSRRHLVAQHDLRQRAHRVSRLVAAMGVLGIASIWAILLRPEAQQNGRWWLLVAALVYVAGNTIWVMIRPLAALRAMPVILIGAIVTWAVVLLVPIQRAEAASSPTGLMLMLAAAAWGLGRRGLTAVLLTVPVALFIGLSNNNWSLRVLLLQVVLNSLVMTIVTLELFWLRRRGERLQAHVRALSDTDALTGVANRRHLGEHAVQLVEAIARDEASSPESGPGDGPGGSIALIVLDLDHFKQINDTRGHASGDLVLHRVGRRLGEVLSALGPDDAVARTGGEEFVILARVAAPEQGRALAERVRAAVARPMSDGVCAQITCSLGVVCDQPPAEADLAVCAAWVWTLAARADRALYHAKATGRDRVVAEWDLGPAEADEPAASPVPAPPVPPVQRRGSTADAGGLSPR